MADVVGVGPPAFSIVLDSIDVYISLDGGATWTLAVPDFKFRQATPFLPLPANSNQLLAGIAPGNSSSSGDILLQYAIPPLSPNTYYVVAVAGMIDSSVPQVDVDIYYFSLARNATIGSGANDIDLLLFHGSPDVGPLSYHWAFDRCALYRPSRFGGSNSFIMRLTLLWLRFIFIRAPSLILIPFS